MQPFEDTFYFLEIFLIKNTILSQRNVSPVLHTGSGNVCCLLPAPYK